MNYKQSDSLKLDEIKHGELIAINLPNTPILATRLPSNIHNILLNEIRQIQDNFDKAESFAGRLAGHIKKEYTLEHCKNKIQDYVLSIAVDYANYYKITPTILEKNLPYYLDTLWVNFQRKYEFNPVHNHFGIISFVIWMKIPYDIDQELKVFQETRDSQTSMFGFVFSNIYGKQIMRNLEVNKNYEGVICFFPSQLLHYVNPFYTSDDYRISISGNVCLKTE